ncbi:MAG: alanine--tRNA ligase, partial [Ignavibacteria bacterium]|nr:alanine--tRNA ligase [Ignavibacteria bacterium]
MNSREIRKSFLEFFKSKDHRIVPSSSVVPYNDPTLLFTNAGMNQFKDVFLGTGTRDYKRAADSQKCIRAGGKHNDLEEVGMDGYHHTFFEMLGNWSFGDYYKKEAIKWAWELLTDVWKLPKEKLWVTVFETDDEAFNLWAEETGIIRSHILRFGEKDNFWEMGDTGPCGPCSEIHFDFSGKGCRPEDVNAGREDVIEIWNLVFIQYNRKKDRELELLPMKHVDTGMGFERIVRVLQNKNSNYETDIFSPLISKICEITGKEYSGSNVSSMNAMADHIRSLAFAVSDGAVPSNEGRGYVLRRILRRASRLARKLDYSSPVLYKLVDTLAENFGEAYPELIEKKDFCRQIIKAEEESFHLTLDRGLKLFNETAGSLKGTKIFPGEEAFKLYDTFGFPLDLTEIMAKERGLKVDLLKFEEEMNMQKERGKAGRKDVSAEAVNIAAVQGNSDVIYNPYDVNEKGIETFLSVPETDTEINLIFLKTNPFYSESGGQISDSGKIVTDSGKELTVIDSKKDYVIVDRPVNEIKGEEKVKAIVDFKRRLAIERNHSATHIVHEALKRILGSHVKQLGSLVHNEYLRFDFPHFSKQEQNQLKDIEDLVNSKIQENIEVMTDVDIPVEEANKIPNVKKFFGDKYGDKVRVVHIDDNFSVEFCGGTHVGNTKEIGLFRITKEESIASGTRRIFARTGEGILHLLNEKIRDAEKIISELPEKYSDKLRSALSVQQSGYTGADFRDAVLMYKLLKTQEKTVSEIYDTREKYLEEKKQTEKELLKQNLSRISKEIDILISDAHKHDGYDVIAAKIELNSMEEFKETGDELRRKLKNGIGLLAVILNNKINLVCAVSDNLIKEKNLSAGRIIS